MFNHKFGNADCLVFSLCYAEYCLFHFNSPLLSGDFELIVNMIGAGNGLSL